MYAVAQTEFGIDELGAHGGTLLQFSSDDVEEIRGRGGKIALEPTDTGWVRRRRMSPAHGMLVELYKFNT